MKVLTLRIGVVAVVAAIGVAAYLWQTTTWSADEPSPAIETAADGETASGVESSDTAFPATASPVSTGQPWSPAYAENAAGGAYAPPAATYGDRFTLVSYEEMEEVEPTLPYTVMQPATAAPPVGDVTAPVTPPPTAGATAMMTSQPGDATMSVGAPGSAAEVPAYAPPSAPTGVAQPNGLPGDGIGAASILPTQPADGFSSTDPTNNTAAAPLYDPTGASIGQPSHESMTYPIGSATALNPPATAPMNNYGTPNPMAAASPRPVMLPSETMTPNAPGDAHGLPAYTTNAAAAPGPSPLSTAPRAMDVATGAPGPRAQEGVQAPVLQIEKLAPTAPRIGEHVRFVTKVRNSGAVAAQMVEIFDHVPRGTQLVATNPPAARADDGSLVWRFEAIAPNEEQTVEMELLPLEEGEIGSVASLRFSTPATARAVVTRPKLQVACSSPPKVGIGEECSVDITVTNPGTGRATGIVLESVLPENVQHPAGGDIRYPVGELKPNESKRITLKLKCVKPGVVAYAIAASGDANLQSQTQCQFEVISPALQLSVQGAKRRFLEQPAVYQLVIANPGTAPAKDVDLAVYLPETLKFEGTDEVSKGQYDPDAHVVRWHLQELSVGKRGVVELKALPIQPGEAALRFVGTESTGQSIQNEHPVIIDGIAALSYEVVDTSDPVVVGGATGYEIQVMNQGTKAAGNIQMVVTVPPELQFVSAEGPTGHVLEGQRVIFQPLPQLAPKARTSYTLRCQGAAPGDARLRVEMQTADMRLPVTKEESTRVFSDQ